MNHEVHSAPPAKNSSRIRLSIGPVGVSALFFATMTAGVNGVEQLLLGWIYFPIRVLPKVTVDWPSVFAGAVAVLGFVVCLYYTLCWLLPREPLNGSRQTQHRHGKTTAALASFVLLLFVAGIAMVGAMHQVVWLMVGRPNSQSTASGKDEPVRGFFEQARVAAQRIQQRNNLKQTGLAIMNLHDADASLPAGGTIDDHGRQLHGWAIYLANFAGYSSNGIDFARPWNAAPNDRLFRCALPEYINPAIPQIFDNDGYGLSHVAGNVYVLPITRLPPIEGDDWHHRKALDALRQRDDARSRNPPLTLTDIRDGIANTLLIGEASENFKPWGHPANVRDPALGIGRSKNGFGGPPGQGGAHFVMCDGSVRFISNRIDRKVLLALGTPTGGEPVEWDTVDDHSRAR